VITADTLAAVSAAKVGPAAMSLVDAMQRFRPEEQAAGFAVSFLILCKKLRVHPGTVLSVAERIIEVEGKKIPEIRAALAYIENEIRRAS
jgi:hypothetical protein